MITLRPRELKKEKETVIKRKREGRKKGENVYVESLMILCEYLSRFYRERRLGSMEMKTQWQHDLTSTR